MITLQNVSKIFGTGAAGLSDVTLQVDKGEFVFLIGHTGSGKTTLLRLLIKELTPTEGSVIVGGWDLSKLPNHKIPHLRKKIGVVFQDLKLLMDRTIFENIMLPLQVAGVHQGEATQRVEELLAQVGISNHRDKFPVQLSGGELQRTAIARALTLAPDILLADEPTGNLDPDTAFGIVELLSKINQQGTTVVMATHNMEIVNKMGQRVVMLEHGKLMKDEKGKTSKKKGTEGTHDPEELKEMKEKKEEERKKESTHHKEEKSEKTEAKEETKKAHEEHKPVMKVEEIMESKEEEKDKEKISKKESQSVSAKAMEGKKEKRGLFGGMFNKGK